MKNRGARIKHLRKAAGFSQERLAAELSRLTGEDITRGAVGNWDHSSDRASDGSRCGDRAADRRPGGK